MFQKTKTPLNGIFKSKALQSPAVLLTLKKKLKKLQKDMLQIQAEAK
jgi:hypothetical protein